MTATLAVSPSVAPLGGLRTATGTGFHHWDTRLRLDGVVVATFRPAVNGSFTVGLPVTTTDASQTLVAEQSSGGKWSVVARLSPLLTFKPPVVDTTGPVVTGISANNITSTSALISWTTNEAATSQVDYGTTTGYLSGPTVPAPALVMTHAVLLTGLSPTTLYHYRALTTDRNGNATVGTDQTFTTLTSGTDTTPPVLSNIVATAIANGVTISWDTDENASGQFDYGLTTAYGSSSALVSGFTQTHFSITVTGLTPGTVYHYRVRSVDPSGNVALSSDDTFIPLTGGGSEMVASLTSSNNQTQFLNKVADLTIDVIELAAGNYTWQACYMTTDRSSRPLTVRPAVGATVNFVGPATTDGSIFGYKTSASYITFSGRDKNGGGAMVFKDFALAQSGVFQPQASDHCTWQYLTFQNLSRDTVFSDQPFKSWCFYISTGTNDHMLIDHCTFSAPAVSRDISCMQIASSGTVGTITVTNILMTNYDYAFYIERPTTSFLFDTWTMTNCGNHPTPASIRFTGAVSIAGTYQNIHATSSDPLLDGHSGGGTITNGGGNSGI